MLFSTAIYFFERDENVKFYSIPAAMWWCKSYFIKKMASRV